MKKLIDCGEDKVVILTYFVIYPEARDFRVQKLTDIINAYDIDPAIDTKEECIKKMSKATPTGRDDWGMDIRLFSDAYNYDVKPEIGKISIKTFADPRAYDEINTLEVTEFKKVLDFINSYNNDEENFISLIDYYLESQE